MKHLPKILALIGSITAITFIPQCASDIALKLRFPDSRVRRSLNYNYESYVNKDSIEERIRMSLGIIGGTYKPEDIDLPQNIGLEDTDDYICYVRDKVRGEFVAGRATQELLDTAMSYRNVRIFFPQIKEGSLTVSGIKEAREVGILYANRTRGKLTDSSIRYLRDLNDRTGFLEETYWDLWFEDIFEMHKRGTPSSVFLDYYSTMGKFLPEGRHTSLFRHLLGTIEEIEAHGGSPEDLREYLQELSSRGATEFNTYRMTDDYLENLKQNN